MSINKEKVMVQDIQFGMFITELDRSWLESPFLLQGFLLEEEQKSALKNLCEYVYVDRTRSTGIQFLEKKKADVAIKRDVTTVRITHIEPVVKKSANTSPKRTALKVMVKTNDNKKKTIKESSFFEIISAIKRGRITQTEEGIIFNMRQENNASTDNAPRQDKSKPDNTNVEQNTKSGFFSSLFGSKKEKLGSSTKPKIRDEDAFGFTEPERFKVSIYENETPRVEEEMAVIYPTFEKSQIATKSLFEAIANQQKLDISTVSDVLDNMVDSISRTPDALMWLARLKHTDNISYGQALNVSINMMAFASFLALPKKQIKEMGLAGLLQDIGKVKIPQRILLKKSKLTRTEFELAKLHIEEGLKILAQTPDIPSLVMDVIAQHHERFNGSGYPHQLQGSMININGQIAGLVDTYCALTTDRNYAKGLHNQRALDEIHNMRDQEFSGELVDQLIQFLGIYPVNSLVELNTGEIAVVIQQNQVRRLQPRLMILLAPDKSKNPFPTTLDLLNSPTAPDGSLYKIIKGIPPDSYELNAENFYL